MEEQGIKYPEEWMGISAWGIIGTFEYRPSSQRISLWALVLHARAIPCKIVKEETGLVLMTQPEFLEAAVRELRLFEEENRDWPLAPSPGPPPLVNVISTVSILLLLAIFHNIVQLEPDFLNLNHPEWVSLGSAHAGRIMSGEWWRVITALTLHADSLHLISNLLIGGVFVMLVCAELGSGPTWLLLLMCGGLGNFFNAALQPPAHTSVGASTALFGAVGILAASGVIRYRRHLLRQRILPLAAALALLAILGTEGEKTDLGAHLSGFVSGLVLGGVMQHLVRKCGRPGKVINALLALSSLLIVVVAWWMAVSVGKVF